MQKQLIYDDLCSSAYGWYQCQSCKERFYAEGNTAVHEAGCTTPGFSNCVYVIGPAVLANVKQWAERQGDDAALPNIGGLSLNAIRQQLPHVFE